MVGGGRHRPLQAGERPLWAPVWRRGIDSGRQHPALVVSQPRPHLPLWRRRIRRAAALNQPVHSTQGVQPLPQERGRLLFSAGGASHRQRGFCLHRQRFARRNPGPGRPGPVFRQGKRTQPGALLRRSGGRLAATVRQTSRDIHRCDTTCASQRSAFATA